MGTRVLGIDLGGTKTEACLYELTYDLAQNDLAQDPSHQFSYRVLAKKRIPTERHKTYADYLPRLTQLCVDVCAEGNKNEAPSAIGLGIPGSIDPKTLRMLQGNLHFLKDQSLIEDLSKALASQLQFHGVLAADNDANCFALAETFFGAGKSYSLANQIPTTELCSIGITLGTGVGGGVVIRGQVMRGRRGGGGEIGHMRLLKNGRACYCGQNGCAEQYLSGTAIEALHAIRVTSHEKISCHEIFARAAAKDPIALATLQAYQDDLVDFLANLSNIFDPHLIVLGGGVSLQEAIYVNLPSRLSQASFLTRDPPAVMKHECGDAAGTLGAAVLAFNLLNEHKNRN